LYELPEIGRLIYTTGILKLNIMIINIKIIATSNSTEKLAKPFLSSATNTANKSEKIQPVKECYGMKLALLTNITIVDDVIRPG
jgi:hypothetical protein